MEINGRVERVPRVIEATVANLGLPEPAGQVAAPRRRAATGYREGAVPDATPLRPEPTRRQPDTVAVRNPASGPFMGLQDIGVDHPVVEGAPVDDGTVGMG